MKAEKKLSINKFNYNELLENNFSMQVNINYKGQTKKEIYLDILNIKIEKNKKHFLLYKETKLISSRIWNKLENNNLFIIFNNIIEIMKYIEDIENQIIYYNNNEINKTYKKESINNKNFNEENIKFKIIWENKYKCHDEKFIFDNINLIINSLSKINIEEYNIIINKIREEIEASGEIQCKEKINNFLNLELMEEKFKKIKLELENMDENYEKIATYKKEMKINEVLLKVTKKDTLKNLINARIEISNILIKTLYGNKI